MYQTQRMPAAALLRFYGTAISATSRMEEQNCQKRWLSNRKDKLLCGINTFICHEKQQESWASVSFKKTKQKNMTKLFFLIEFPSYICWTFNHFTISSTSKYDKCFSINLHVNYDHFFACLPLFASQHRFFFSCTSAFIRCASLFRTGGLRFTHVEVN